MTDMSIYSKSIQKGWEILCVVSMTFPPSKNLESYLNNFVDQHKQMTCANKVDVMSEHVSRKLERICARGAKGKVLTAAEIDRAKVKGPLLIPSPLQPYLIYINVLGGTL